MTPIGADPERGDEDEFIESFGSIAEAAMAILEALAEQDRERIEQNREEIAAYERKIETQRESVTNWRKRVSGDARFALN